MLPQSYHFLHLFGAILLIISIGGQFAVAGGVTNGRKVIGAMHGIGLIVLLVAGIGFLHKSGLGFPKWAMAKIGIWVIFGLLPLAVKKRWITGSATVILGAALATTAAWLGYFKPF